MFAITKKRNYTTNPDDLECMQNLTFMYPHSLALFQFLSFKDTVALVKKLSPPKIKQENHVAMKDQKKTGTSI